MLFGLLGFVVGILLLELDRVIHLYTREGEESKVFKSYIGNKELSAALTLVFTARIDQRLFHNVLFQVFFIVLSFLVLTSSLASFGHGLVLGGAFNLLATQGWELFKRGNIDSWFWNLKVKASKTQRNLYFFGMVILFLLLVALI